MKRLFLLVLFVLPLHAADPVAGVLAEYLHRAEAFGFAGSVLVARDGEIVLHETYGLADPARGIRIGPHMPFYVASISKPFTAAAILRLEMEGKLAVDDSIANHLPNVPEPMRAVTIHHLLTHTSGIADLDAPGLEALLAATPRFEPGERHRYSNNGYALLAAIIERAGGEPFPSYLRSRLFAPAGMSDTRLVTETAQPADVRARRGGHDQGDAFMVHRRPYPWDEHGPTGLVTTAADLYRWDVALRGTSILSAEAKRKYESAHVDGYGYGWATATTSRGTRLVMHQGLRFPEGWNGDFRRYLDDRVVIIVLSNVFRRGALSEIVARDLARIVFGGEITLPPPVASSPQPPRAGEYRLPTGGRFLVRGQDLEAIGQDAVNLIEGQPVEAFAAENERTRALVDAIRTGTVGEMATDDLKRRLAETWQGLVERFGPYVSHEVLHTARMSPEDEEATTFVRLRFERASTVGRYVWHQGTLVASFDLGSFEGPMQQVEVFPAPMPLLPQSGGGFATWDFAGRANTIRFLGSRLQLHLPGGRTVIAAMH